MLLMPITTLRIHYHSTLKDVKMNGETQLGGGMEIPKQQKHENNHTTP